MSACISAVQHLRNCVADRNRTFSRRQMVPGMSRNSKIIPNTSGCLRMRCFGHQLGSGAWADAAWK